MTEQEKRSIVLINKRFQFKLIARFIAVNILVMVIFGFLLYLFLDSEVEANLRKAHVTFRSIKEMLLPVVLTLSVINVLISSLIIGLFVLLASHKVAGPLYRFNQAVKELGSGNLRPLTAIRDGDQLYECSITLADTVKALSEDFGRIREKVTELGALAGKDGDKTKMESKLEELEGILGRYRL